MSLYSAGRPPSPGIVSSEVIALMTATDKTAVITLPKIWMKVLERIFLADIGGVSFLAS